VKWTIQELRKLSRHLHHIEGVIDVHSFLTPDDDILDISDVRVQGEFHLLEQDNIYVFDLDVETTLMMPCAVSLKEVEVPLHFQTSLEFAETFVDDNTHIIEGITIDLDPVVYSEILIEKPMRVVHQDAYLDYHEEIETLEDDENNNPFAALKNKNY